MNRAEVEWKARRTQEGVEHNRLRIKATSRAQRRLAKIHQEEYRRLMDEERRVLGLPALGLER